MIGLAPTRSRTRVKKLPLKSTMSTCKYELEWKLEKLEMKEAHVGGIGAVLRRAYKICDATGSGNSNDNSLVVETNYEISHQFHYQGLLVAKMWQLRTQLLSQDEAFPISITSKSPHCRYHVTLAQKPAPAAKYSLQLMMLLFLLCKINEQQQIHNTSDLPEFFLFVHFLVTWLNLNPIMVQMFWSYKDPLNRALAVLMNGKSLIFIDHSQHEANSETSNIGFSYECLRCRYIHKMKTTKCSQIFSWNDLANQKKYVNSCNSRLFLTNE